MRVPNMRPPFHTRGHTLCERRPQRTNTHTRRTADASTHSVIDACQHYRAWKPTGTCLAGGGAIGSVGSTGAGAGGGADPPYG